MAGTVVRLNPDALSLDQARAALNTVDEILGCVCDCEIAKAGEGKPLPFENAMVELLLTEWGGATKSAVKEAIKKLNAGTGEMTAGDVNRILKLIDNGITARMTTSATAKLFELIKGAYSRGKRDVFKKFKKKVVFNQIDTDVISWLSDHHVYWIGNYYNKHVSEGVASVVQDAMSKGLGRKQTGAKLKEFFGKYSGVRHKPDHYWRGLAANAMSRSRNFGLVQSYVDLNVSELKVVSVMDERTSPICRKMNGTVIPVSKAIEQRDLMMAAEDPEDVKTIAPWPSVKTLEGLTDAQIIASGVCLPPYHFRCRTTVVESL